ncbi:unnamed protein product, partial [Didymodactylos carnosus]
IYSSIDSSHRTLIVGDVHGCIDELNELISKALPNYDQSTDMILFVGDLVGKGPSSLEVVDRVRQLGGHSVLGNHDQYLLKCAEQQGRLDELKKLKPDNPIDYSYLACLPAFKEPSLSDSEHHALASEASLDQLEFLSTLPLTITIPFYDIVIVHAGLRPQISSLNDQNPFDLLKMRDILDDGSTSEKRGVGQPWASKWSGKEFVVFGHDAARNLQVFDHALGLDTACCYGKELTGYLLPDKKIISVKAKRIYSKPEN